MEQLKNNLKSGFYRVVAYVKELHDIRVLGVHVFVAVAILVTWSGIGVIQDNYELQKQITELNQQTQLQQLENDTLRLRNEYYSTEQYQELTARRQFGLGAPGETLLLVPSTVAMAHSVDIPDKQAKIEQKTKPQKPTYQRNFEAWTKFLFRR